MDANFSRDLSFRVVCELAGELGLRRTGDLRTDPERICPGRYMTGAG